MFEKINEIKAREWMKTLTEEQLDKQVVLRDNWGDSIVSGELRLMIENSWIKPEDNIDIDKTDVVNGNSIYFGTVPTRYIDADKLWNNRPKVLDGKSQDYIAGFMECMWGFYKEIRKSIDNSTADVVSKSEVERLTVELDAMRGAANTYKMHYENAMKEIERLKDYNTGVAFKHYFDGKKEATREIFEDIKTCMKNFEDDDDGYLLKKCEFEFFMRELEKKYAEDKE